MRKRAKSLLRIGIIDLGTNSIRAFVFECRAQKKPKLIARMKEMVRLGDEVFTTGAIGTPALKRTLNQFEIIHKLFDALAVQYVHAFGTSALRAARNSKVLISSAKKRYGIKLEKLSHKREAELIGNGVIRNEGKIAGHTLIVDIGGGSVEVVLCKGTSILVAESFELGAAAVQQRLLKKTPPKPGSTDRLRYAVREQLSHKHYPRGCVIDRAFASSGSIRTIAKAIAKRPTGKVIEAKDLAEFVADLSGATRRKIAANKQIEKKRIDLILGSAVVLDEILAYFHVKKIVVTPYALKDGIIASLI